MKQKYFIITIDTEGDNLWEWQWGTSIGTENARYLSRFQELCNQYRFKPTWLANWEMIHDDRFVAFAKKHLEKNECEVGMHLHAWNTPPAYELCGHAYSGLPYLTEYPTEIMREKIKTMTFEMEKRFGKRPLTHRAGRWGMNDTYFRLLKEEGYLADVSVTPHVNWEKSVGRTPGCPGPDYTNADSKITVRHGIIEIPVTIVWSEEQNRALWLRPNRKNLEEMLTVIEENTRSGSDYLMFMLHSSELMPGGSPTFRTEGGIGILYEHLDIIFKEISKRYIGAGLEEYIRLHDSFRELRKQESLKEGPTENGIL